MICTKHIYRAFNPTNFFKVEKSCSQILDFRPRILFLYMLFYLFLAALGHGCCIGFFFLVAARGGYCSLQYAGFSLPWLLLLQSIGLAAAPGSRDRLNSCGTRA